MKVRAAARWTPSFPTVSEAPSRLLPPRARAAYPLRRCGQRCIAGSIVVVRTAGEYGPLGRGRRAVCGGVPALIAGCGLRGRLCGLRRRRRRGAYAISGADTALCMALKHVLIAVPPALPLFRSRCSTSSCARRRRTSGTRNVRSRSGKTARARAAAGTCG